jgi:L-rhamnose mutarotase
MPPGYETSLMTYEQGRKRYGSLIRLKPEYEERYIILHRHTFPGVLGRLRDSNIRNYSIFLRDGMLFSFFEYVGTDYAGDMEKIGADPVTRDWWKLTDPMQVPLETIGEGERWAEMPELLHRGEGNGPEHTLSAGALRFAYVAQGTSGSLSGKGFPGFLMDIGIQALSLYAKDDRLYIYLESTEIEPEKHQSNLEAGLERSCADWHPMREVFHTD